MRSPLSLRLNAAFEVAPAEISGCSTCMPCMLRVLNAACFHFCVIEFRLDPQPIEQLRVAFRLRIFCREQHVADKNRIGTRDKAQGLQFVRPVLPSRR